MRKIRKPGRTTAVRVLLASVVWLLVFGCGLPATAGADEKALSDDERGRSIYGEACLQCHSASQVLLQRKTRAGWARTVYSMIGRGAQVVPEDIGPLVAFLVANYGPDAPLSGQSGSGPPGQLALAPGPGQDVFVRKCGQCHALEAVIGVTIPKTEWQVTIDRMVSYGADLSAEEVEVLVDWLSVHNATD